MKTKSSPSPNGPDRPIHSPLTTRENLEKMFKGKAREMNSWKDLFCLWAFVLGPSLILIVYKLLAGGK